MLRRRGCLTYRAIQLQLDLDDEYVDAIKDELIDGQQLSVDEEGKVLVWIGDTTPSPAVSPTSSQPVEASATIPHPPEAERRQLTVMFCDLVGSTQLSAQLDPEAYLNMVRVYQTTCAEVIQRFDGYIAQYLGDGLLVYFGYPIAHEDDVQRAVRAALGCLAEMGKLNPHFTQDTGRPLAVRIGIHTGPVVVGEIGTGESQERLAMGETPNIAARLQGLAEPDTVVISAATFQLVHGYFECHSSGSQLLRGISAPIAVYQVIQASGAQSRLDIAPTLTDACTRRQKSKRRKLSS